MARTRRQRSFRPLKRARGGGLDQLALGLRVGGGRGGDLAHLRAPTTAPSRRASCRLRERPPRRSAVSNVAMASPRPVPGGLGHPRRRAMRWPSAFQASDFCHPGGKQHLAGRAQPAQLGEQPEELGGVVRGDQIGVEVPEESPHFVHRSAQRGGPGLCHRLSMEIHDVYYKTSDDIYLRQAHPGRWPVRKFPGGRWRLRPEKIPGPGMTDGLVVPSGGDSAR